MGDVDGDGSTTCVARGNANILWERLGSLATSRMVLRLSDDVVDLFEGDGVPPAGAAHSFDWGLSTFEAGGRDLMPWP